MIIHTWSEHHEDYNFAIATLSTFYDLMTNNGMHGENKKLVKSECESHHGTFSKILTGNMLWNENSSKIFYSF